MVLVAFLCFALLFIAWLIAPGLDRSPRTPSVTDAAINTLPASAHI